MRITKRVLHLPPYLSTSWRNVAALHLEERTGISRPILVVQLVDGSSIEVADLNQTMIERIFDAHAQFLEEEEREEEQEQRASLHPFIGSQGGEQVIGLPFQIGPQGMEGMGAALQHDPAQANAPELPPELMEKVTSIAQILGSDTSVTLPEAVDGCNCFHCQIGRAIKQGFNPNQEADEEEIVSDEDLSFRDWDVAESGEDLYTVTNPLDNTEQYQVFLGNPVGCTCGGADCEHIKIVLRS